MFTYVPMARVAVRCSVLYSLLQCVDPHDVHVPMATIHFLLIALKCKTMKYFFVYI